jgi:hypothetical protein
MLRFARGIEGIDEVAVLINQTDDRVVIYALIAAFVRRALSADPKFIEHQMHSSLSRSGEMMIHCSKPITALFPGYGQHRARRMAQHALRRAAAQIVE